MRTAYFPLEVQEVDRHHKVRDVKQAERDDGQDGDDGHEDCDQNCDDSVDG